MQISYFLFAFKFINHEVPSLSDGNRGIQCITSVISASWERMSQMLCWTSDVMTGWLQAVVSFSPSLLSISQRKRHWLFACACVMHAFHRHIHISTCGVRCVMHSAMHSSHPASSIDPSFKPITAKNTALRTQRLLHMLLLLPHKKHFNITTQMVSAAFSSIYIKLYLSTPMQQ